MHCKIFGCITYRSSPRVSRVISSNLRFLTKLGSLERSPQMFESEFLGWQQNWKVTPPQKTKRSQRQLPRGECKGQSPVGTRMSSGRRCQTSFSEIILNLTNMILDLSNIIKTSECFLKFLQSDGRLI